MLEIYEGIRGKRARVPKKIPDDWKLGMTLTQVCYTKRPGGNASVLRDTQRYKQRLWAVGRSLR